MNDWLEFWNGTHRVYVNDRHREVHYRRVATDIIGLLPDSGAHVLDYGAGEARFAGWIAASATRVTLCEAAAEVRGNLTARYAGHPKITVISEQELSVVPGGSVGLLVANSVVQYLGRDELERLLTEARRLLAPAGVLLISDVVPRAGSVLADATSLLRYAIRERFFWAALRALAATAFSPYTRIRRRLGLTRYDESEMLALLSAHGFSARRHTPNLSHNQSRLAFLATRRSETS
ncbi:class I SAM-dependent methyltransferase [Amycolatopsis palatopharyngis]|uniref:class I SAM-dependent methyltransferase n=1 Tax=Amycolatopsis palatopharyngis TaxID=187982 RepID=UPI001B86EB57|nr:methyltransferase domain-containing protein [Amycolatopsis palatopharyngis]